MKRYFFVAYTAKTNKKENVTGNTYFDCFRFPTMLEIKQAVKISGKDTELLLDSIIILNIQEFNKHDWEILISED